MQSLTSFPSSFHCLTGFIWLAHAGLSYIPTIVSFTLLMAKYMEKNTTKND